MSPTDVFLVSCGMGCKQITVSDIAYIEAMKDNCIIHMVDGKRYTQSCPMGGIEPELNPNMFKRIHHSFIVNIRYIDMYYYGKRQGSICHDEQVAYKKATSEYLFPTLPPRRVMVSATTPWHSSRSCARNICR